MGPSVFATDPMSCVLMQALSLGSDIILGIDVRLAKKNQYYRRYNSNVSDLLFIFILG